MSYSCGRLLFFGLFLGTSYSFAIIQRIMYPRKIRERMYLSFSAAASAIHVDTQSDSTDMIFLVLLILFRPPIFDYL